MKKRKRVGAIIIENDKLLLVKGKGFSELWIPGGKIEMETELDCLKRELKEELDVNLVSFEFFGEFSSPSFYSHDFTINRLFLAKIKGVPKARNEIESIVWLSKKDFINKKFPMIPLIEEVIIPSIISAGYF